MPLLALGLNHQSAPIEVRERVALPEDRVPEALAALLAEPGVSEAAFLSTCNRTELYCCIDSGAWAAPSLWLQRFSRISADELEGYLYQHRDAAAVRHLFRVATGLDSLVLGEPQVLGQVKAAWQQARATHTIGSQLDRLFQHCFKVAKRVRTDTQIGAHPVSIAFAAVRLAEQVFTDLSQATVLLIGAGDTIELAARHLADHRVHRLLCANRTLRHAQTLASRFGGVAFGLDHLERHLDQADIVISATASREPVLRRLAVERAMQKRRRRPVLLLDLAVPRDVEGSVATVDDVYLYTVDDLQKVIEENRNSRLESAAQAEAIIDLETEHFLALWRSTDPHGLLRRLRAQADAERDQQLARARAALDSGRHPEQVLQLLAHGLTNKLLHAPSFNLRAAALRGDLDLLRAAERLYEQDNDAVRDAADIGSDDDDAEHSTKTRSAR